MVKLCLHKNYWSQWNLSYETPLMEQNLALGPNHKCYIYIGEIHLFLKVYTFWRVVNPITRCFKSFYFGQISFFFGKIFLLLFSMFQIYKIIILNFSFWGWGKFWCQFANTLWFCPKNSLRGVEFTMKYQIYNKI